MDVKPRENKPSVLEKGNLQLLAKNTVYHHRKLGKPASRKIYYISRKNSIFSRCNHIHPILNFMINMICIKLPWISRQSKGWYFNEVICINRHCMGKTLKSMWQKWIHIHVCGYIIHVCPYSAVWMDRPSAEMNTAHVPSYGKSALE